MSVQFLEPTRVIVANPSNQHRITPKPILDIVREFMPVIALDPFWNPYAVTDAEFVADGVEADGLLIDWGYCCREAKGGVWVQPPWKRPKPAIEKIIAERAANPKMEVLLWLPFYPETEASALIWHHMQRGIIWGSRVNHPAPPINADGSIILDGELKEDQGSMWASWLTYFGPAGRMEEFEDVFRPHGVCLWGWNEMGPRNSKVAVK